jgi:hypothetical protein
MEVVIEGLSNSSMTAAEATGGKKIFTGISRETITEAPKEPAAQNNNSADELINSFKKGMPDVSLTTPEQEKSEKAEQEKRHEAKVIEKDKETEPDPLTQWILGDGIIEGFIVNILSKALVWVNVFVFNLVLKNKKHVEYNDVKLDESDKEKIKQIFAKHGKEILQKLNELATKYPELVAIGFLEFSLIQNMNNQAEILERKTKREESIDKEEETELKKV